MKAITASCLKQLEWAAKERLQLDVIVFLHCFLFIYLFIIFFFVLKLHSCPLVNEMIYHFLFCYFLLTASTAHKKKPPCQQTLQAVNPVTGFWTNP